MKAKIILVNIFICMLLTIQLNAQSRIYQSSFLQFVQENVSLLGGLNLSNQNINIGNYNSRFNYNLENFQNNAFKAGYFIGFRINGFGSFENKYDCSISLNKVNTGNNYKVANSLNPFLGSFTKFKADESFFIMNLNTHYKKQINPENGSNRIFYFILGPSIDIRLSDQSIDNQVNDNYGRFSFKGDIGLEYDNQSYYTLFVHYIQPITSFTKSPIQSTINSFEVGTVFKINDIY